MRRRNYSHTVTNLPRNHLFICKIMQKQCLTGANMIFQEITGTYANEGVSDRLKTEKKVLTNV